ncbi:MAG: hypothetical protein KDD33_01160 [Bdellovibrionales bacterium]|nr:hypothetical protein [Bdellovibrionales bacterium]
MEFRKKLIIRRGINLFFLIGALSWMVNCNQFHTFTSNESDAHLSTNPVFEDPEDSFLLDDQQGNHTTQQVDQGVVDPLNPVDEPKSPPTTTTVNLPPIRVCTDNASYQILRNDGSTYTHCRPCEIWGTERDDNGTDHRVCLVERCDGEQNRYVFLTDLSRSRTSCQRCDVLDRRTGVCTVRVEPPVVQPPRPTPVVQNPTPCQMGCGGDGGDGGGDGGDGGDGDPLMIDTVGDRYANVDEFASRWEDPRSYIKPGELNLSSPEQGTKFNLLGHQSQLQVDNGFYHINDAGKNFEYQISWIDENNTRYRFLALPNEKGQILGIDQLFGDNTFGPDPQKPFAKDGFHALMKFDMNQDQYIDSNDVATDGQKIYDKLRLWHDYNRNGKVLDAAEAKRELITLQEAKIRFIHLKVNHNYYEIDDHGNEITYKSLVGFDSDGGDSLRMGMAFDVWFQYRKDENPNAKIESIQSN